MFIFEKRSLGGVLAALAIALIVGFAASLLRAKESQTAETQRKNVATVRALP
jgi:Na+/H+-dicarboxylate symporter